MLLRARAGLRRPRADGAGAGRLPRRSRRATTRRRWSHGPQGVELLSNICRHRQAIMLNGRGNTPNIVCPIHRWTYDLQGKLLGAPHFADSPCRNLGRTPLQNWNGLLFDGPRDVARDLARPRRSARLDFSGYVLDRVDAARVQLQLEDVHRGLSRGLSRRAVPSGPRPVRHRATTCAGSSATGTRCRPSASTTGSRSRARATYERWHKAVLDYLPRRACRAHGAIWLTYYPNIMVEWYPHVLVVSTLDPARPSTARSTSSSSTIPRRSRCSSASSSRPSRPRTSRRRARTTRSPSGWTPAAARCTRRGAARSGPYQSPMEDGMQHFHEFYRREMRLHLAALCGPTCRVPRARRVSHAHRRPTRSTRDLADPALRRSSSSTSATISRSPELRRARSTAQAHVPGALFAHLDRDLSAPKTGRNGRHPLPDARSCGARRSARLGIDATQAGRRLRQRQAACTRRACGGCCAGSATTRSRCSTAASRNGSAKAARDAQTYREPQPGDVRPARVARRR